MNKSANIGETDGWQSGEMRLHLCDYHLEAARLHLAQGHTDEAHSHWETAREMVDEMGYHRRDAEVAELKAALLALGLDV